MKRPVGARLAAAAAAQMYPDAGLATSGPTISGCRVAGSTLTILFNQTLLNKDTVYVQPFDTNMTSWSSTDSSGMMVCAGLPPPPPAPGPPAPPGPPLLFCPCLPPLLTMRNLQQVLLNFLGLAKLQL